MVLLCGGVQVGDGVLLVDVELVGDVELADGLGMGVAEGGALGVAGDGFKAEYAAACEEV